MSSEPVPKQIEKKDTQMLPFSKYWRKSLSSIQEYKDAENEIRDLLWLKNAGLTYDEIKLYQANEAGLLDQQMKVEPNAMELKLEAIYCKMKKYATDSKSSEDEDLKTDPSTNSRDGLYKPYQTPLSYYPEGHPMNRIKEIEVDVFGHLYTDNIPPISKRRKMLRRFERKKERVLAHERQVNIATCGLEIPIPVGQVRGRTRSLSDMDIHIPQNNPFQYDFYLNKDRSPRHWYEHAPPPRNRNDYHPGQRSFNEQPNSWRYRKDHHLGHKNCHEPIGPKNKQMFTIRGNKIVRVDADQVDSNQDQQNKDDAEEVASQIPIEDQLLEGTKMSIDNIRKIERFKDYDPGVPSKTLYLKNIAPEVSQAQVSLLFNQFVLANGGPVTVRLMTYGRMRGQAFVEFQREDICIQALSEANGTILSGQPIIAQFGRTNNRPLPDDNR